MVNIQPHGDALSHSLQLEQFCGLDFKFNDGIFILLPILAPIIAAPYSITDEEKINISEGIKKLDCEIKTFQIPFIKAIIKDKKEMLLIFSKFEDEKVISQTSIGVWNQYTEFVETIVDLYNLVWTMDLFSRINL